MRPIALCLALGMLELLCGGVAAARAAVSATDVFDVPRVSGIVVDGDGSDWKDAGLRIDVLSPSPKGTRNLTAGDAWMRLGWDDRGMLVLLTVREGSSGKDGSWKGNWIEAFLANDGVARDLVQVSMQAAMNKDQVVVRPGMRDHRATRAMRKIPMACDAAVQRQQGGAYVTEFVLPWSQLELTPKVGSHVNFQLWITLADGVAERAKLMWYPLDGANYDKQRLQRVRLSDNASPPTRCVASGVYERFKRMRLDVAAAAEHAGQAIRVLDGGRVVAEGPLKSSGRLATATLNVPLPRVGESFEDLAVFAGQERLATVEVEDLAKARRKAFEESVITFSSFVFADRNFPKPEFENPSLVEDLVGRYELKTTYYDAKFNAVERPVASGRYGAIVEAVGEHGETIKRSFTLYRHDKPADWRDAKLDGTFALPKEFGIDAAVIEQQSAVVSEGLVRAMRNSLSHNHDTATILAGLAELPAGAGPVPQRLGPWQRNAAWWYELRKRIGEHKPYQYDVRMPQGSPPDGTGKWPLLIFLHGIGERGNDLRRVAVSGPLKEIDKGRSLPFIVMAPQCPAAEWWSPQKLDECLDEVLAKYPVQPERVYLTGLSMGGFGSWTWATFRPDRFAAVAPICGGGDPLDVQQIKDVPIWVFHGGKDTTVRVEQSYDMVKALRDVNGRVRFTLYPEVAHDSWTETYGNPDLYTWMLAQTRGRPAEPPATTPGTQPSQN